MKDGLRSGPAANCLNPDLITPEQPQLPAPHIWQQTRENQIAVRDGRGKETLGVCPVSQRWINEHPVLRDPRGAFLLTPGQDFGSAGGFGMVEVSLSAAGAAPRAVGEPGLFIPKVQPHFRAAIELFDLHQMLCLAASCKAEDKSMSSSRHLSHNHFRSQYITEYCS